MRGEEPSLIGRDHLMYRSYYVPVKGAIDGDLCERFRLLSNDKKQKIAAELDRSVREVEKKLSVRPSVILHCDSLLPLKYLANQRVTGRADSICLLVGGWRSNC